jgi:hypothetical protein
MKMSPRQNKFYAISLFCLIPAVGIILSIILIFFAIFDFKSRTFLLVLLLEIGVNISILFYVQNQYKDRILFVPPELVSYDLDKVAEKLEQYKNKNGSYPDSLQQLQKEFPNLNIGDTILRSSISKVKFANYYYQKKSVRYILFSTGWDRIPFNEDDIYPHDSLKKDSSEKLAK